MKLEMQSYQKGINYERERIKRILTFWFTNVNNDVHIEPKEIVKLMEMINDYNVARGE